jgi:hypothetical protein
VIVSFLPPQALKVALNEQGLAGSGTRFTCCHSLVAGFFTLDLVEQFTQPRASLV